MKRIIDIPEIEYKIIRQYQDISPNKTHALAPSIINSTPLNECEAEDCISRKEVKKLIKSGISVDTYDDQDDVCKMIDNMPSVYPKSDKPVGKWISYRCGIYYVCSNCKERNNSREKYCPNCGAKMGGINNVK